MKLTQWYIVVGELLWCVRFHGRYKNFADRVWYSSYIDWRVVTPTKKAIKCACVFRWVCPQLDAIEGCIKSQCKYAYYEPCKKCGSPSFECDGFVSMKSLFNVHLQKKLSVKFSNFKAINIWSSIITRQKSLQNNWLPKLDNKKLWKQFSAIIFHKKGLLAQTFTSYT